VETVYAVVFWWHRAEAGNNTLAAFLPGYYEKKLLKIILSIHVKNNREKL
jgi:hypothetical protein